MFRRDSSAIIGTAARLPLPPTTPGPNSKQTITHEIYRGLQCCRSGMVIRIRTFPFRIGSAEKNLGIVKPKKFFFKLSETCPRIRILIFCPFRIQGSKKASDPGSATLVVCNGTVSYPGLRIHFSPGSGYYSSSR
jgi:hypothetical protein